MNKIVLPKELETLVEAEVAAGRAPDVTTLVASAVRGHLEQLAALRQSLDEAEADYDTNGGVAWNKVRKDLTARLKLDAGDD